MQVFATGYKGSNKTKIPVGQTLMAIKQPIYQINDKTQFHMVKGIDNAFDHMEMCFVL